MRDAEPFEIKQLLQLSVVQMVARCILFWRVCGQSKTNTSPAMVGFLKK